MNWKSIKKPYVTPSFREPLNITSPIENITQQITSEMQAEHERLVVEAFSAYGYTKDWVIGNIHRVHIRTFPITIDCIVKTVYGVDQRNLFAVLNKVEYQVGDDNELKANITTSVEYIKPIGEEDKP